MMDRVHRTNGSELANCLFSILMHAIEAKLVMKRNISSYWATKLVGQERILGYSSCARYFPASVTKDVALNTASFQIF